MATIETFLSRSVAEVAAWEAQAFDAQAGPSPGNVVLHGAGRVGIRTLRGLRAHGVEPLAFSDRSPSLWGTTCEGLAVLPPDEAARRFGGSAVFVVTIWNLDHSFVETQHYLEGLGCARVVSCAALFYRYPGTFLPWFSLDLPHRIAAAKHKVRAAYDLLADDESREEFLRELRWRMALDFSGERRHGVDDQHFPADLVTLSDDEVFFDCGAFDGDTVLRFLDLSGGRFRKVVAFEADPRSFDRLRDVVAGLKGADRARVELHRVAVGATAGTVRFNAEGLPSSALDPNGSVEVASVPLDAFRGRERPTYVKMDIEGAEVDALRGGRRLLAEAEPTLAVCVYHRQADLWEVPLAIAGLSARYALYLRRHAEIPMDLECYGIRREA